MSGLAPLTKTAHECWDCGRFYEPAEADWECPGCALRTDRSRALWRDGEVPERERDPDGCVKTMIVGLVLWALIAAGGLSFCSG